MRTPQLSTWLWCLIVLTVITLLVPIAAAFTDRSIPSLPVPQTRTAAALPAREMPLPGYQQLVEQFPLVSRDLPDPGTANFVAAYDTATIHSTESNEEMVDAAVLAFPDLPGSEGRQFRLWLQRFLTPGAGVEEIPVEVLEALQGDPLNGDRLSNLAVASYFVPDYRADQPRPFALINPNNVGIAAMLEQTVSYFPKSRVAVLNLMYFAGIHEDKVSLNDWIAEHPDDITAISLSVQHRTAGGFLTDPTPFLVGLTTSDDSLIAAIGYAWLGDLEYSKTSFHSTFTARYHAWEAIAYYDQALALSDDPAVYAARASALEYLGEYPAAIATQERAVALAPESVTLRLRLADIFMRDPGNESERLASLRQARDIQRETFVLAKNQHDVRISDVYYWVDPFALSHRIDAARDYASSRPHQAYIGYIPYGGAGGFLVSMDLIPEVESRPNTVRPRFQTERAIYDAVFVSIALGDPEGVSTDFDLLNDFLDDSLQLLPPNSQMELDAFKQAQVVADINATPLSAQFDAVLPAANVLRWFGLTEKATQLCRAALDIPELESYTPLLLPCLAENAYLSGDIETARRAYSALEASGEYAYGREGLDHMRAGFVAQIGGDFDEARRLYEIGSLMPSPESEFGYRTIALTRLGDVYLESGDAIKALDMYDQSLLFQDQPSFSGLFEEPEFAKQYALNNRGIARLKILENSSRGITCSGTSVLTCEAALVDFAAALRADPYNPVYLLNVSWVERLMGNHKAAVEIIDKAVSIDSTLYPALNDRGVISAIDGDYSAAESDFVAALATNPDYDIALWNLGMLELQNGPIGLVRGQTYLALAVLLNPSLETRAMSYQYDDSIYRVEVNQQLDAGTQWAFGTASSVTTSAIGFVTLLILGFRIAMHFAEGKLQDKANTLMQNASEWTTKFSESRWSGFSTTLRLSWLLHGATVTVLVLATFWTSRTEIANSTGAGILLGLYAVLTAVLVHELGHALMARKFRAEIQSAQWGPGVLLAMVLLPFGLHSGPFPGQQVEAETEQATWWVYLGGPLANFVAATGLYLVYYFHPLPGIRLLALVQVAAAAYSLLPFHPLDGEALSRKYPWVLGTLAMAATISGLLFRLGRL